MLAPNVRGSTGYGMAWRRRIYQDWGGIDLEDFAAAAGYCYPSLVLSTCGQVSVIYGERSWAA